MNPEQVAGLLLSLFVLPALAYLTWRAWRGRSRLKVYSLVYVRVNGVELSEETSIAFKDRETLPAPPETHDWLGPVDE